MLKKFADGGIVSGDKIPEITTAEAFLKKDDPLLKAIKEYTNNKKSIFDNGVFSPDMLHYDDVSIEDTQGINQKLTADKEHLRMQVIELKTKLLEKEESHKAEVEKLNLEIESLKRQIYYKKDTLF